MLRDLHRELIYIGTDIQNSLPKQKFRVFNAIISFLETNESSAAINEALIYFGGTTRVGRLAVYNKDISINVKSSDITDFGWNWTTKFGDGKSKVLFQLFNDYFLKIRISNINFKKPFAQITEVKSLAYNKIIENIESDECDDLIASMLYYFGGKTKWNALVKRDRRYSGFKIEDDRSEFLSLLNGEILNLPPSIKPIIEFYFLKKCHKLPHDIGGTFNGLRNILPPIDSHFFALIIAGREDDILAWEKIANKNKVSLRDVSRIAKDYGVRPKSKADVKKENNKFEYEERVRNLKEKGYLLITNNIWMNEDGDVIKNTYKYQKSIKPFLRENNKGMKSYAIHIYSKQKYMHRLVATYFVENANDYKYVSTKDGDFMNYSSDNLIWVEYPAVRRVKSNFEEDSNTWLSYIINNFEPGINITILSEIIAEKATDEGIFKDNNNKVSTIYATITKYSEKNRKFHVFTVRSDLNWTVYLNKDFKRGRNE